MLEDTIQSIGLTALQGEETPKFTCFLRSVNGGEFVFKDIKETCERYTIFHTYTYRYGIVKKEGPALSPWVQGLVARTKQSRKCVVLLLWNMKLKIGRSNFLI